MKRLHHAILLTLTLLIPAYVATAQQIEEAPADTKPESSPLPDNAMGNEKLDEIIKRLDENVTGQPGFWQFQIGPVPVTVITDESHDRMRIIVPITETAELDGEMLYRVLQANFDTALDARYAIARDVLWSTFIHPLASLDDEEFLSGLGQTINLASTFGTSYNSGLLSFGGGDSSNEQRQLIEDLIERGQSI